MVTYLIVIYYLISLLLHNGRGHKDQKEVQRTMNKYELAIVVGAKVEEEARTATLEKVKSLVTRFGGVVSEVKEAGVKKLAYEIQKQNEGFYYFVRFEANADAPAQIESTLRIMKDELLRFLCVSVEE